MIKASEAKERTEEKLLELSKKVNWENIDRAIERAIGRGQYAATVRVDDDDLLPAIKFVLATNGYDWVTQTQYPRNDLDLTIKWK